MGVAERVPSAAEFDATLDQWSAWITDHTDTLLTLDERARVAGTPGDQVDIAAAFVAIGPAENESWAVLAASLAVLTSVAASWDG